MLEIRSDSQENSTFKRSSSVTNHIRPQVVDIHSQARRVSSLPSLKHRANQYFSRTLAFLWNIEDQISVNDLTADKKNKLTALAESKLEEHILNDLKKVILKYPNKKNIVIPEYDFTKLGVLRTDFEDIFVKALTTSLNAINSQEQFKSKKFILTNSNNYSESNTQRLKELKENLGKNILSIYKKNIQDIENEIPRFLNFPLPMAKEKTLEQMQSARELITSSNSLSSSITTPQFLASDQQPNTSVKVGCVSLFKRLFGIKETQQLSQVSSSLAFGSRN